MCARRFLMVILVLTLLVVAGAFAIFQFGDRVLIDKAKPKGHFVAAAAGGGPDYKSAANWVSRPGLTDDPASWLPDGVKQGAVGNAAVFYIHPTTYLYTDRWNAPLQPGGDSEFRTRLFTQSQASAFNGAGQIWAPRYRQAAFGAFLLKQRGCEEGTGPGLWRRPRCLRPVRKRGRRSADHSRRRTARARSTSSGCFASGSPASRSPSGWSPPTSSAGRSAAPPTCPPSASPLVRRPDQSRLHPVVADLRRTGQPGFDRSILTRARPASPAPSASARICCASTR